MPATMRLRMGKLCLSAVAVERKLRDDRAVRRDALEQILVLRRENQIDSRAQNRNRPAFAAQRALMRRRVNPARAAAHHGDADIGELIRQLARGLDAVMRRHPRADHRHGIFVLRGQFTLDIKHQRRIVNFAEQRGIIFIRLKSKHGSRIRKCVSTRRRDQWFFPSRQSPRRFRRRYCGRGAGRIWTRQEFGRVAEMFEQRPRAHRADVFNEIERDQGFAGIHARIKGFQVTGFKFQVAGHCPQNDSGVGDCRSKVTWPMSRD